MGINERKGGTLYNTQVYFDNQVKSSVDTENYSLLTLSALYGDVEMGQT